MWIHFVNIIDLRYILSHRLRHENNLLLSLHSSLIIILLAKESRLATNTKTLQPVELVNPVVGFKGRDLPTTELVTA